jgi:hypothetical protein
MTDDNVTQLPTKKNEVLNNIWEEVMKAENKIEELEEQISLVELIGAAPSGPEISVACDEIKRLLLEKNIAYGNSALSPIQIFAKAGAQEGIANRIDDKLNRIKNAQSYPGDNDVDDLIGYLILYKISQSS